MKTQVERVYDISTIPKNAVLVDRLWPRGISKEKLHGVPWLKELTPSRELLKWFHEDREKRWEKFSEKYCAELQENSEEVRAALKTCHNKMVLLTAVKDIEKSHIPTLQKYLEDVIS